MRQIALLGLAALTLSSGAWAESSRPAAGAQRDPQVIRLTVRGRAARPQVVTAIKRAEVRFEVGTGRYAWPSPQRRVRR